MRKYSFLSYVYFCIVPLFLFSCSSDLSDIDPEKQGDAIALKSTESDQAMILAAHKCNEISKLSDAIDYGIESYEVDIHVDVTTGVPRLMIGHELETTTGQTFVEYMDDLMEMNPNFKFLWLDFKDLNSDENESIIRNTLSELDSRYDIKQRVLVESRYIEHLTSFANDGWNVSFYSTWSSLEGKTTEQQKIICEGWLESMQNNNVDGISFDARVYQAIKNNFENKAVGDKIVKQYAWNYYLKYTTADLQNQLQKYSHLSVLLISFPVEEIPKLIIDVQFAENGVATNQGRPLNSLPSRAGSINVIETQFNAVYNKYEAIFDGTNFFYIPYSKEDEIGSVIKDRFTMELLFAPTGGVNPFSSMESGGLGYELTTDGYLAFYYNANNSWVLPANNFKTSVQMGGNAYYHVFVTYDKSTFKMYVNGVKVKEKNVSGQFTYPKKVQAPDYLFGIGGDYRDSPTISIQNPFIGKILHAKLYRSALSDSDIVSKSVYPKSGL
ncbi:LamG-like jellyroll fold domain-containing protein [Dysgonomonas sp.]